MKVKVSEATEPQLDWMVGMAMVTNACIFKVVKGRVVDRLGTPWEPTTSWAQGGPIIEREKLEFRNKGHLASYNDGPTFYGETHLIAAMRCFCVSKLGDEVEVPEELS